METYDFDPMKRGDSIGARNLLTFEQPAGTPLAVASALMQIKTVSGVIVYEWKTTGDTPNMTITGAGSNTVTMGAVTPAVTKLFPPGQHRYDVEVTFASGLVLTAIGGLFPVLADVSIPTA